MRKSPSNAKKEGGKTKLPVAAALAAYIVCTEVVFLCDRHLAPGLMHSLFD